MRSYSKGTRRLAPAMLLAAAIGTSPVSAQPQGQQAWSPDGSVNLDTHDIPFSAYASEAFKQAYLRHQNAMATWPTPPALDAPKAEWDKYDADEKRLVVGPSLELARQLYPVEVTETALGGVNVAIVTPKGGVPEKNKGRVLINVHGGAFMMGRGLDMGLAESIPVSAAGGYKVVTLDYRQAPYNQFPAASEDVEAVYRALLKTNKPEAIGIYGCSAGGLLTAESVAWLRAKGLPRPGAVGVFCAGTTKFSNAGDSEIWGPTGSGPLPAAHNVLKQTGSSLAYLAKANPDDPLAYPGVSDAVISSFPPTLYLTGTRSMEMSLAVVSHAQMLRLGVDSQLYVIEGGWHGSHVIDGQGTPEVMAAIDYVAKWFDEKLAR